MIFGERIRLRALEEDDLLLFVRWLNDPEVRRGLVVYLPLSYVEEKRWFESMIKRPPAERPLMIEVEQQGEWLPIGDIGFHDIDWRARSAEVGIVIGEKDYWDQGYGTEAMRLMLAHGFKMLNLRRIFLQVYTDNPRAVRAYEKVGFVHEGRMRQARYYDGGYYDILLMSVLRSEWQED